MLGIVTQGSIFMCWVGQAFNNLGTLSFLRQALLRVLRLSQGGCFELLETVSCFFHLYRPKLRPSQEEDSTRREAGLEFAEGENLSVLLPRETAFLSNTLE